VAERWVAKIVNESSGCCDRGDTLGVHVAVGERPFSNQPCPNLVAQAAGNARDLHRMRQSCADGVVLLERKHLSLVLKALDGRREDQSTVVTFELVTCVDRALVGRRTAKQITDPPWAQKSVPVHQNPWEW